PDRLHYKPATDVRVPEAGVTTGHDHEHEEHDHGVVFGSWSWTTAEPVSLNAIKRVVAELPPSIFRCKGILYLAGSADRRGILHVVGNRVRLTLGEGWGDQPPGTQIVCIGAPGGVDPDYLNRKFEAAVSRNTATARPIVNAVTEWQRG
ncbi:MAG: GTP-binding protein, partial [Sulfuricaulis sp.]|nr:GTP-binding protein [Sulfuricaulis sp.]